MDTTSSSKVIITLCEQRDELIKVCEGFISHYEAYRGGDGVIGREVTPWLEKFESVINQIKGE